MALEQFNDGEQRSSIRSKINGNFTKLETVNSTGNPLLDKVGGRIYGTNSTPISGNITLDETGSILGGTAVVFHQDTVKPTISSTTALYYVGGEDKYATNEVNVICFSNVGGVILAVVSNQQAVSAPAGDTTAPTFIATYPQTSNVGETTLDVLLQLDEVGTGYATIVPDGTAAPTSQEVKDGTATGALQSKSVSVTAASTTETISFTALSSGTAYDIYVVAEDDEATPNLQANPTKIDVTTATGDITAPTISSATVEDANPDKLVVVFSETVNIVDVTGLTISGNVTPTLSAPTGDGSSTLTFTLSAPLANGDSVTLDVAGTNTITDTSTNSNSLAATSVAITNNVAAQSFSPSDISPEYSWHKFDYASAPVNGGTNDVLSSSDSLTTTVRDLTALGTPQRVTEGGSECIQIASTSDYFRFQLDEATDPILKSSFSFGFDAKLSAGTLDATRHLMSVFEATSNRINLFITTDGKLNFRINAGGNTYWAKTLNAEFDNLAMTAFKRITVTLENNVGIKLYLDDTELSLDPSYDGTLGDMSVLDFSNKYFTITGGDGSGIIKGVPGFFKHFTLQPVVYTVQNITDLMTL